MPAYIPPPRRVLPPLPSKEVHDTHESEFQDEEEDTVPLTANGLQARMASLNLNQVGLNPSSRPLRASRPSSLYLSPSLSASTLSTSSLSSLSSPTSSLSSPPSLSRRVSLPPSSVVLRSVSSPLADVSEEKLTHLLNRRPPPIPIRSTTTPVSSQFREVSVTSHAPPVLETKKTEAKLSRPPPPARLPPPPPPCLPTHNSSMTNFIPGLSCIKCHDFSQVDFHAKQFPEDCQLSEEFVRALTEPFDTETEKARALFAWFYHSTASEIKTLTAIDDSNDDPEVLRLHFVNMCAGFAQLFLELIQHAGLQGYVVRGYSKTYEHRPPKPGESIPYESNDTWNCILMDGDWHLIVPTWGRGFISETESIPPFASRWFRSSPLEFRQTHYPEDPTYQLVSEEDDGGLISWETFITAQPGPKLDGAYHEHDLHPAQLQPDVASLCGGQPYTFSIFKKCEHLSVLYEDNYCFVVFSQDLLTMEPLIYNAQGGLSATVTLPNIEDSTVCLGAVRTIAGRDAKGLDPQRLSRQQLRKTATLQVLVQWNIV